MRPERFRRLRSVLDRRQPDLTVLMDRVHKAHNLSAVLRSCDAVGVLEVHAVSPEGGLRLHRDTSGGAAKWIRVHRHPDVREAAARLRLAGMRIVAAEPGEDSVDFRTIDYTRPTAILLGAELFGISEGAMAHADRRAAIPMVGMGRSLNVSVAAALILYEAQRQRAEAGMYDRPRVAPEDYRRILFEWAHPDLADRCRRAGQPYPPLDEEGRPVAR